jgi:hypothetical protein
MRENGNDTAEFVRDAKEILSNYQGRITFKGFCDALRKKTKWGLLADWAIKEEAELHGIQIPKGSIRTTKEENKTNDAKLF